MNWKLENGLLRATKRTIFVFGIVMTIFGFIALGTELWRTWTGLNPIRIRYLALALIITGAGLTLIQTLNPMTVIHQFFLFLASRVQGGQRWTDPPPEDAPPPLPREKWPPPPPRHRRRDD